MATFTRRRISTTGAQPGLSGRCCFTTCLGEAKSRKFEYIPPVKGTGLADVIPARGAAFGDLFNDGKIDVVVNPIDGPPVLLRNVNPDHHHWVEMSLVGGPKGPRDATCATVYLKANGMRMRQDVLASGSYISANDRRPALWAGRCDRCWHGGDSLARWHKGDS